MTMSVDVVISNPNEIRLAVTADLPLEHWREIVKRVDQLEAEEGKGVRFYGPLNELIRTVRTAVHNVCIRENIKVDLPPPPAPQTRAPRQRDGKGA